MNNTRILINSILTLLVLIILCNSRKIEKYMAESDEPMDAGDSMAVEDSMAAEDSMDVEDSMAAEDSMDVEDSVAAEDSMDVEDSMDIALSQAGDDGVGVVDSTTVDLSLPSFKMPSFGDNSGEMGYYDFAKIMYF